VTVAAVVERDGRFLLVEERTEDGLLLNQPAGHLEPGESLEEAAVREALEETAYEFRPSHVLGIYLWPRPQGDITYLRVAFSGSVGSHDSARPLDEGIVRSLWLTPDEVRASRDRHRSPLVWRCVEDHIRGVRAPLDLLVRYP
jgi:8-oxo-dGTP pyrophosphatase MutT (NUDIX family)